MSKKILIVDDDPMLRKMYAKKFEIAGFEVEVASNGEEGMQKAQADKFNLIISDVMMPKLDGLSLLKQLKADSNLQNIPVILLTNVGGSDSDKNRGIQAGAVDYLIKSQHPPAEIIEIAKKYLS
ncbi:response regulator transcription factor [Patescibacteria group bacterium]